MEELLGKLIETVAELGVTTFLDYAPIILSAVAVFVAIYVPGRIAKKQNQIAAFDKLYTAYSQLLMVKGFSTAVQGYAFSEDWDEATQNRALLCIHFETAFGYRPILCDYTACLTSVGTATSALRKNETQAYMLPMLISKDVAQKEACSKKLSAIYESLFLFVTDVIMLDPDERLEIDHNLTDFITATEKFFAEYADTIEAALMCNAK